MELHWSHYCSNVHAIAFDASRFTLSALIPPSADLSTVTNPDCVWLWSELIRFSEDFLVRIEFYSLLETGLIIHSCAEKWGKQTVFCVCVYTAGNGWCQR